MKTSLLAGEIPLANARHVNFVDMAHVEGHLKDAFRILEVDPACEFRDNVKEAAFNVGRFLDVKDHEGKLVLDEAPLRKRLRKIAMGAVATKDQDERAAEKFDIERRIAFGFADGRTQRSTVVVAPRAPTPEEKRIEERVAFYTADEEARRVVRDRKLGERASMASKLLTDAQLADRPGLEPLIEGVLFRENLAMLFGLPGTYKSFLAISFACSVATGTKWMGRDVARGPVLYVAAEGSAGLGKRVEAWAAGWYGGKRVEGLVILPEAVNLSDEGQVNELADLNAERGFALIVIDTWAMSLGGADENSASATSLLIERLGQVRRASPGTSVLVVHHRGKTGNDPRGSIALLAGVDTALSISGERAALTLEATKQKDIEGGVIDTLEAVRSNTVDSLVLQRRSGALSSADDMPEHLEESLAHFRRLFSETGATKAEFKGVLIDLGLPRTTAYRHANQLLESKRLWLSGNKLVLPRPITSIDETTTLPTQKES